ncbi:MAG: hypothetical protein ACE5E3_05945, partial [Mariprofundus sp.]
ETLDPGQSTAPFRIDFEEVPLNILHFLLWALQPGHRFCHKIGYGKAFGFGSVRMDINGVDIHWKDGAPYAGESLSDELANRTDLQWTEKSLDSMGVKQFLHLPSVERLARILCYEKALPFTFTYPAFDGTGFHGVVSVADVDEACDKLKSKLEKVGTKFTINVNLTQMPYDTPRRFHSDPGSCAILGGLLAEHIAKKPALDFQVYQQRGLNFKDVNVRTLALALRKEGETDA